MLGDLINKNLPHLIATIKVVWDAFNVWFENTFMGIQMLLDGVYELTDGIRGEFSAIELLVIGMKHPFESVLFAISKVVEKILSAISSPFRKIMHFFNLVAEGILKVIQRFADFAELEGIADFAKDAQIATAEYRKALDAYNDLGAFDGVLFGGFQDDYMSNIRKTARETREAYNVAFKGFNEALNLPSAGNEVQSGKATEMSALGGMASLAVAGSIEAFKIENQTDNMILDVNRDQLKELRKMSRREQLQYAGFVN